MMIRLCTLSVCTHVKCAPFLTLQGRSGMLAECRLDRLGNEHSSRIRGLVTPSMGPSRMHFNAEVWHESESNVRLPSIQL